MDDPRSSIAAAATDWLAQLRFPTLFKVVLALFVADLLIPDGLPFFDEVLLGLLAAFLGRWRRPAPGGAEAERDVTPRTAARGRGGAGEGRYSARSSSR